MGYTIVYLEKVDSTNNVVAELIERGVNLPLIVVAREQIKGRGRYGRGWYSPPGGLWFSIGDRIKGDKRLFTLYLPLAVVETLGSLSGVEFSIRIPNDVVVMGKKISGVLVEEKADVVISGIGINVNIREFPEDIEKSATSLFLLKGREYDLDEVLEVFIKNYDELKRDFEREERGLFLKWKCRVSTFGKRVKLTLAHGEVIGELLDLDESFNLLLKREEASERFSLWDLMKLEEL
jgi:BirA family biotin operon repressor/biotin-[acetyl-CoA-carboxylase] ligase